MARKCDYSGKGPQMGKKIVRRGKAKREGGIGQNVTGISKRRWEPNLQTIRQVREGASWLACGVAQGTSEVFGLVA